jgi:hypothetical protein
MFNSTVPTIIPIDRPPTAIRVTINYRLSKNATEELQLSTFGFVFDRATEEQKHMVNRAKNVLYLFLLSYTFFFNA